MRSSEDFDSYYKSPDPWRISKAQRRDRVLSRIAQPHIAGKRVLELGCGEGHLTATVFAPAKSVLGVDISGLAIARADALRLPNAVFAAGDFLDTNFEGYDAVAAIECLYYLSATEQEAFFNKLSREHAGLFIMSAPIIGASQYRTYFTHAGLLNTFERHRLKLMEWCNLNAYRQMGLGGLAAAVATRLSDKALPWTPERFVYQRCYILSAVGSAM